MKSSLWCGILFAVLNMTKIHDKNPEIRTGMYTSMESVCRRKNASPQQLFSISFGSFCYFVYHNLLLAVSSGKWHIPTKLRPKQVKLKNTFYSNRKRQKFLKNFVFQGPTWASLTQLKFLILSKNKANFYNFL